MKVPLGVRGGACSQLLESASTVSRLHCCCRAAAVGVNHEEKKIEARRCRSCEQFSRGTGLAAFDGATGRVYAVDSAEGHPGLPGQAQLLQGLQ